VTEGDGAGQVSFDHVALAVAHMTDPWPLFADALGGRYVDRGINPGFGWTQLRFAHGFVIEGLHPELVDPDDFLPRFLARSGPGPHHLTFKVPDLQGVLGRVRAAGIEPVGEDVGDPLWQEAFLHPRDAHGIVVQLAQTDGVPPPPPPEPEGFPDLPYDHPVASLGRVVHAVADLEGALALFRDLLGGRVVSSGSAVDGNHWVELAWSGPGRLRLLEGRHAAIAEWLDGRPGRVRHLFFNFDEPSRVPGAVKVAEGRWAIEPDDVLGVRVVIASTAR
jgi:catechol 2,3-dioxygenase-like lactoylglutathione lyase family enzyme